MSQYTWTNPQSPSRFPTDLRSWIAPASVALLAAVGVAAPFFQTDYPNPTQPTPRSIELRTWAQPGLALITAATASPFAQTDYPNPRGYVPGISLRTHIDGERLKLIGLDQFYYAPGEGPNFDYPNPTLQAPRGVELRSWTQSGLALSSVVVSPPFFQTDYPNPRGYTYSIDVRTSVDPGFLIDPPAPVVDELIGRKLRRGRSHRYTIDNSREIPPPQVVALEPFEVDDAPLVLEEEASTQLKARLAIVEAEIVKAEVKRQTKAIKARVAALKTERKAIERRIRDERDILAIIAMVH